MADRITQQSHRSTNTKRHLYSTVEYTDTERTAVMDLFNQERGAVRIYLEGDKGLNLIEIPTLDGNVGKSDMASAVADVHSPDSGAIRSSNRNPARQ